MKWRRSFIYSTCIVVSVVVCSACIIQSVVALYCNSSISSGSGVGGGGSGGIESKYSPRENTDMNWLPCFCIVTSGFTVNQAYDNSAEIEPELEMYGNAVENVRSMRNMIFGICDPIMPYDRKDILDPSANSIPNYFMQSVEGDIFAVQVELHTVDRVNIFGFETEWYYLSRNNNGYRYELPKQKQRQVYRGVLIFDTFRRPLLVSVTHQDEPKTYRVGIFNKSYDKFLEIVAPNTGHAIDSYRRYYYDYLGNNLDYNIDPMLCYGLRKYNLASLKRIVENSCFFYSKPDFYSWMDMVHKLEPIHFNDWLLPNVEFGDGSFMITIIEPHRTCTEFFTTNSIDDWNIRYHYHPTNYDSSGPFVGTIVFDRNQQPVMALFREGIDYVCALRYTADSIWEWSALDDIKNKWFTWQGAFNSALGHANLSLAKHNAFFPIRCLGHYITL